MPPRANDVCSKPISKLTAKLSRRTAQIEIEIHGRFFVQGIVEVVPIEQVIGIERKSYCPDDQFNLPFANQ